MENTSTENQTADAMGSEFRKFVKDQNKSITWTGVAYALLGILALSFPVVSTMATTATVGLLFIFFGGVTFFSSFSYRGTGPFFGALLTGLLSIGVGVYMLMHQDAGAMALTMMVAVIFMVDGAFQTAMAYEMKPADGWGWIMFSALISIAAGIMVIASLPDISMVLLGILIGVNFLSSGIAMMMMSHKVKKAISE